MIKKAELFENIIDMLEDRGYEIDEIELEDFLGDISDDEYFDLKEATAKGNEETVMEYIGDLPLKLKTSNREKRRGYMQKKAITPVKPTKKVDKGKYTAPDGSFKEMSCPKDHEGKNSKFCGCLRYQMARGLPLENAEALCGYIKKKKYGDKLYDNFEKDINLEKIAQYELGDGFELYFYDLKSPIQNELLAFFGMNDPSEGNFEDIPVVVIPQMEGEEPMEKEFASVEPRRRGKPLTDRERLKRHKRLYPEEEIENEEELPERGTGLKRGERYHPPTTEELKVDPSGSVDVFLSERTPEKGSDVSDEWEKWCDEKKISDEAEEGGMNILRGRGFKVSKVEEVTSHLKKSAYQRFMEKKAGMFYVEEGDEVELSKDWRSKEWIEEVGWLESPVVELDAGLKGKVVYTNLEGEFHVDWENGIRTVEIADVETEDAIKKIGSVKRAWTIEKKKISEGEHKKRLDKIRSYEKDIGRELNQDEAEDMYYKLGREGISQL